MNLYKVTTPTTIAYVFAEDANAAINCFVELIDGYKSDINCIEQIACERQSRLFKSSFPSRLVISINGVKEWLERNGYNVTRKDK